MTNLHTLIKAVDELTPDELETLYQHIEQRRQTTRVWIVSPENLEKIDAILRPVQQEAESMTEEEINEVIDAAIAEVRRERKKT